MLELLTGVRDRWSPPHAGATRSEGTPATLFGALGCRAKKKLG